MADTRITTDARVASTTRTLEQLRFDVQFSGNIYQHSIRMNGWDSIATWAALSVWESNKAELAARVGPMIVFDTDTLMLQAA